MSDFKDLPIPSEEKDNLSLLQRLLGKKLTVVGGAKDKKWPRPDIDVLVEVEDDNAGGTELKKAERRLKRLEKKIGQVTQNSDFEVNKINQPYPAHDFQDENILEHGGTIEIKPKHGTVIEIIPHKK